jgi:thiol-disulfide isomerase/thioredoxin
MLRWIPFLAIVGCAPAAPVTRPAPPPAVSAALPAIDVVTLEGEPTQIAKILGGRPGLVSLWATWCEACATEFEPLARLSAHAGSVGAVVLAVAVGEPRDLVKQFVQKNQLAYPQFVDEQFRFADSVKQKRVPATLVIDREGRVVYAGGVLDELALAALEKVITQPGRASASR